MMLLPMVLLTVGVVSGLVPPMGASKLIQPSRWATRNRRCQVILEFVKIHPNSFDPVHSSQYLAAKSVG
jgi:hypothetical protein